MNVISKSTFDNRQPCLSINKIISLEGNNHTLHPKVGKYHCLLTQRGNILPYPFPRVGNILPSPQGWEMYCLLSPEWETYYHLPRVENVLPSPPRVGNILPSPQSGKCTAFYPRVGKYTAFSPRVGNILPSPPRMGNILLSLPKWEIYCFPPPEWGLKHRCVFLSCHVLN